LIGDEKNNDTDGIVTETTCQSGRSGTLYARWWVPTQKAVEATVVIVHGLGEHGGRYEVVAKELARDGWACLATDLHGHGKSPGRRGHIPSYFGMLQDIGSMRETANGRFPNLPQVLLGHSMGGNLVANYVLRQREVDRTSSPLAAMVLSGPMFLPSNPPNRTEIFAAWVTGYLVPWFTVRAPVDTSKLTRNTDTVEAHRVDPLVHNRISVYLATQLLAQGRYALDHAPEIRLPTLLMHGEDDPITSFRATESFAIRAGEIAKFVSFPNMLHEIFHETEAAIVFETLRQWLTQFKGTKA